MAAVPLVVDGRYAGGMTEVVEGEGGVQGIKARREATKRRSDGGTEGRRDGGLGAKGWGEWLRSL